MNLLDKTTWVVHFLYEYDFLCKSQVWQSVLSHWKLNQSCLTGDGDSRHIGFKVERPGAYEIASVSNFTINCLCGQVCFRLTGLFSNYLERSNRWTCPRESWSGDPSCNRYTKFQLINYVFSVFLVSLPLQTCIQFNKTEAESHKSKENCHPCFLTYIKIVEKDDKFVFWLILCILMQDNLLIILSVPCFVYLPENHSMNQLNWIILHFNLFGFLDLFETQTLVSILNFLILALEVSGVHARIQKKQGNLLVTDLDSTNGTFIDEKRLKPGVVATASPGSCIIFGIYS